MILVYALIVKLFTGRNPARFFKGIALPIVGFSTSSSAAYIACDYGVCRRKFRV